MAVHSGLLAVDVSDGSAADAYFRLAARALAEGNGHMDCHTRDVWQRAASVLLGQVESEEHREAVAAVAEMNNHMVDSTVRVARAWRADVLVYSPMVVAGLLAAAAVGIPAILHGLGLPYPTFVAALEAMTDAQERHGLDETPAGPMGSIDLCPESVRPAGVEPGWAMRYVPHNGSAVLPDWLFTSPGHPRVCVTLGSVLPVIGGGRVLGCVIDALAAINVEVVVAVGDLDLSAYGPLPVNVRVTPWVPLSALLPSCAAIIHQGGAGSTFTAFAFGVPQLMLPHLIDHSINASAVMGRGTGVAVPADRADVESVRAAVDQVLADRALRTAAAEVRDEIAAMPGPDEAVQHLSQLALGGT
jgi:glycosyltransferase